MDSREQLLVNHFEELLQSDDSDSIKEQLPKLLKSYIKNANRMDKILKQSDTQQLNVLKLTETLAETNKQVNNLLDNAGQGFLYFNKNMTIGKEYSKEAKKIFNTDIYNQDITKLLYKDDTSAQLFLKATLQGILGEIEIRQEILISLLENEFILNNRTIKIEYKVLNENTFMMILTDITDKKELDTRVKEEQQILKMVVEIISSTEQFLEIKKDYEDLISKIDNYKTLESLPSLRMEIHTYKGLFAQKEMLNVVQELHNFESKIDKSIKNKIIEKNILDISTDIMYGWIQSDINILRDILGNDFFNQSSSILIKKDRLNALYKKIKTYKIKELTTEIKELNNYHIKVFLRPYKKLVEQLSKKLNKQINPLIINSDDIYIDIKFKPFINSLVHIFRNSIDHGIESMEERFENNKNENATISCNIKKINNNLEIEIEDDGQGIDIEKIKALAISKGLYSQDEISTLNKQDILKIIFQDNFSTSENITDISGRGVGLASVLNELTLINGYLEIKNIQGKGVKFIFIIPLAPHNIQEKDLLNKLANRTISYFEQELNLNINKHFNIEYINELCYDDITAIISLSGDMNGTIGMSVSNNLAFKIIENFIFGQLPQEELDELKAENIAETLNVTLGNILQDLEIIISGGNIDISIPYMLPNKMCVTKKDTEQILICKLELNGEIIILSYFI